MAIARPWLALSGGICKALASEYGMSRDAAISSSVPAGNCRPEMLFGFVAQPAPQINTAKKTRVLRVNRLLVRSIFLDLCIMASLAATYRFCGILLCKWRQWNMRKSANLLIRR